MNPFRAKIHSEVVFLESLPSFTTIAEETLVIYDDILPKVSKSFKKNLKTASFSYAVKAGESLKDIHHFPKHISRIVKLCEVASVSKLTIVVVGGGSVGDFGGFVASVFKRGVGLVQIPTTWLSAIDSAHGGKTAMNVADAKNQIGTFYPASKIIICKDILLSQPPARAYDAFGELYKIALIDGGNLWKNLSKENHVDATLIWKYLKDAIKAKYKVVSKDPTEKLGIRHVLNLGHTLGHVFEVLNSLPHGLAVNYGLTFCIELSRQNAVLSEKDYRAIKEAPISSFLLSPALDGLLPTNKSQLAKVKKLLLKDKKKSQGQKIRFVLLKSAGKTVIKDIQIDDLLLEWVRQAKTDNDE